MAPKTKSGDKTKGKDAAAEKSGGSKQKGAQSVQQPQLDPLRVYITLG